jgi:chemotaxis protein CheC
MPKIVDSTDSGSPLDLSTRDMQPILTAAQRHHLAMIFDRGAESASQALSKWLGRPARLTVSAIELLELAQASELLGPADSVVTACTMGLHGRLTGLILLVFADRSGLALVDLLTQQPLGTTTAWGELEQSAAKETTNIVGCAYLGALATHLPSTVPLARHDAGAAGLSDGGEELIPTPPTFVREFAGSLLEFALMEQAVELDQVLVIHSEFQPLEEELNLDWTLLFVPSRESLHALAASLDELESHKVKNN